ncbi:MAG: glycoside hydrolase family 88 protein [Prevotellaceae bacterium]|nr:glycoside hydrolase family 88 protein [Prevotellaceae bacterium]
MLRRLSAAAATAAWLFVLPACANTLEETRSGVGNAADTAVVAADTGAVAADTAAVAVDTGAVAADTAAVAADTGVVAADTAAVAADTGAVAADTGAVVLPADTAARWQALRDTAAIVELMDRVAKWQTENFRYEKEKNLHDYGIAAWTNAVFYLGLAQWMPFSGRSAEYTAWLTDIGAKAKWEVAANFESYPAYSIYHADELCAGRFYLAMYERHGDAAMLASVNARLDRIMGAPPDTSMSRRNKQSWTWCDALFMAPPVYASMASISGNDAYLTFMDEGFRRSYRHLFDPQEKLFFRDDSYFDKREANGKKIFWGRGNGWAAAGVAGVLEALPSDAPQRPFYETLLRDLAKSLAALQNEEGCWHASLLDPASYPAPEASATALIAYAIAYGVGNNILPEHDYLPVLEKAWTWLASAVNEDGKLGWVQPIGADPKKVTADMTSPYGPGALLMAGAQVLRWGREK